MLIAADYPFLDLLWTMIIFFAWLCWFWMMVVLLSDVFTRRDIGGWGKAAWTIFLIVLPFVGVLTYLVVEHDGIAERREDRAGRSAAGRDGGTSGAANEIASAKQLLDQGVIDAAEFEHLKHRALAAR